MSSEQQLIVSTTAARAPTALRSAATTARGCGRVVFALDRCGREAMSFLATTSGVSGENVRDLMLAVVEHRFGPVNGLPAIIE